MHRLPDTNGESNASVYMILVSELEVQ